MSLTASPLRSPAVASLEVEHVVLLDPWGRAAGTLPKAAAHGPDTPLHLAFSCHVVGPDGRLLLTQRSSAKRTWPGVWTNACCGHPQLGEPLRNAVERRLRDELGARASEMVVALPDFAYRAEMDDGTVEHELCPVVVARLEGPLQPAPSEVAGLRWIAWDELVERAREAPGSLSPWSVAQILRLDGLGWSPADLLDRSAARRPDELLATAAGERRTSVPGGLHAATAFQPVLEPVEQLLEDFIADRCRAIQAIDPALADVSVEIDGLVAAGGKRLRPAFVYWGHRATGADHDPGVLRPAGAVELLHTFALLHDDVMDRSAVRRGRPSGYAALAERHRREQRLGDSDWFGCSAAVLAGDLAFVWADELFESTPLAPDVLARARCVFTTLRAEVIAGQYLDLGLAANPVADEAAAEKVALLKSARYTVTRPLLLGAALSASGGSAVEGTLRTYGDAVGIAFQMRDDVLGVFGDPARTGKGVVEDLREGKRTLLVLRAERLATPAQRRALAAGLGDPELDEEGADRLRQVIADTGARASVEALISAHHATAQAALAELPPPASAALAELAALAIERCA